MNFYKEGYKIIWEQPMMKDIGTTKMFYVVVKELCSYKEAGTCWEL